MTPVTIFNCSEQLASHYEKCWGAQPREQRWKLGPTHELGESFRIFEFGPGRHRSWIYATSCMSPSSDEHPLELHLFSRHRSPSLSEPLTAVAHYHRTGARLGLRHSVNFGRPWLRGSLCDHGVISLPYLDGPDLEWFHIGPARVRCLWLIPVTTSEVESAKASGFDALETSFEQSRFDYLDAARAAVA